MPVAEALKFAFAVQTPLSVLTVILEGHVSGDLTIVAVPEPDKLVQPATVVCVTV